MIRHLSFREAMEMASKIGILEEKTDHSKNEIVLILANNTELHFRSEYDSPRLGGVIRGRGVEPPSVYWTDKRGT